MAIIIQKPKNVRTLTEPFLNKLSNARDYMASEKYDGQAVVVKVKEGVVTHILNANGQEIVALRDFKQKLNDYHKTKLKLISGTYITEAIKEGCDMYEVSGMLRNKTLQTDVQLMIHDYIKDGHNDRARVRFNHVRNIKPCAFYKPVRYTFTSSLLEADSFHQMIKDEGGEGVVYKDPNSLFNAGARNNDLMKRKNYIKVTAKVLKHIPGLGYGAYSVELENGVQCKVSGISKKLLETTSVGDKVMLEGMYITKAGRLREPKFYACK